MQSINKNVSVFCVILFLSMACGCFTAAPAWCDDPEPEDQTLDNQTLNNQTLNNQTLNRGFYYTIKKGDTLWDLSQRFFDSPWIWPDMWEKNKELSNPHWIYPGNKLRILTGKGMDSGDVEKTSEGLDGSEPGTLEKEIERYYFYPAIDSVGFLKKKPIRPSGKIVKARPDYLELVGEGDIVYITPKSGTTFKEGEQYTVYRETKTYTDEETSTLIGIQHFIVGIVDVFEVYNGIATAYVYRSFRNIEIDDLVTPYHARSPHIKLIPSAPGIQGRLVAHETEYIYFGDQEVVYIDKGQNDGIAVGQTYSMFFQEEEKQIGARSEQRYLTMAPINTGELLILHTEATTASAVITDIHQPIKAGMEIRTP